MESLAHAQLKRLAGEFLGQRGCLAHATEVCCPISRFRIDVAGWIDREPVGDEGAWPWRRRQPMTVMIECKQSRADFLRDASALAPLLRLRDHVLGMQRSIEEQRIKREEPELRISGSALFAEIEEWNFAASRLPGYRRVIERLERLERKLYGEIKFIRMAHYALADRLYIAAPRGMIRPCELPSGWGLLECPPEALRPPRDDSRLTSERPTLQPTVEAPRLARAASTEHRIRLLRNIAAAATAAVARLSAPGLGAEREAPIVQTALRLESVAADVIRDTGRTVPCPGSLR